MRLFFSELRKLLGNVKILLVIAAAAVINVLFLVVPEFEEYSPSAYNALWDILEEMNPDERTDYVAQRIAASDDSRRFTGSSETEFTDNFYSEQELLQYVYNELSQVEGYSDYLNSIDQSAENMKTLSFFADEDSFNYRNIIKTTEDFSRLSADNVGYGRSKGILLALRFGITDILLFLLIVIFGVKLISSERESGFFPLLQSTANGKIRLAAAKLSAVILSGLLAALLLYGGNFAAGAFLYGFGDTSRAFASVFGYFSCGIQITVMGFFLLFSLVKILLCIAMSALVFAALSVPLNSSVGFAAISVFAAFETVLYFFVPSTSIFSVFRQVNIAAAADTAGLIGKYLNVNLFGMPVSAAMITLITTAVFAVVCAVGGMLLFTKSGEINRSTGVVLLKGNHTNLVLHELYKSLICGKGIIILAVSAAAFVMLQNPIKPQYNSISEYYYYNCLSELSGEYTDEKSLYIDNELMAALSDYSDEGRYKAEALQNLRAHADYLKENNGYFVADKGYELLTGGSEAHTYDRLITAVKSLILVLIVSYSYYVECRFGGDMLLRSSLNGRAKTFAAKLICAAAVSLAILLIFDGSRLYSVLSCYGTENILAPVCSIERLANFKMPIALYLIFTELGRFVGMLLVSASVFAISKVTKSYSLTIILSMIVFVLPPLLSLMGFDFMDYFAITPLLVGNVFI